MIKADRVHSTPPENTSVPNPDNPSPDAVPAAAAALAGDAHPEEAAEKERTGDDPDSSELPSGVYLRTDVTPETLFQAIGRLRKVAQDEIDRLLAFLDTIEDPVLEDDEVEDGDDAEDGADDEPSLASLENHPSAWSAPGSGGQERWAAGNSNDAEGDEHDGREPACEDEGAGAEAELEASLGWTEQQSLSGGFGRFMGWGIDTEEGTPACAPQGGTTYVGPNVRKGRGYDGLSGLTDEQQRRLKKAMRYYR